MPNLHNIYRFILTNVNNIKAKVYRNLLKEVAEKYYGPEDFINNRFGEICSQKILSDEEVIYFLVNFLSEVYVSLLAW